MIDIQLIVGLISAALAIGWIAHEHGLVGRLRRQLRARRTSRKALIDPEPACNRFGAQWRAVANDKNARWM